MGVVGMTVSGIIPYTKIGVTLVTWYLGDLVGTVLLLPLIVTWRPLIREFGTSRWTVETTVLFSMIAAFSWVVLLGHVPQRFAANSLLLLTVPLTLAAAFRFAQPGVALLVNVISVSGIYLTLRGTSPFLTQDTNAALQLLQLFMMVTMIAGLSLAIAIEQLRSVQASFRKIWFAMDQAADAVFLLRPDASFEYVNARAAKLLGYTSEQLTAMSVYDVDPNFSPSNWPEFWHRLRQDVRNFESVVHRQDGTAVPVEIAVGYLTLDGKELGCAIVKDISARRQAEESRGVFEQILNSTSAVIYQKDLQGRYEFVNERWRYLFNIDPTEAKGKTDYDLFPSTIAAAFRRNDDCVIENQRSIQIEEVATHADGPHTYVSVKFPVWTADGEIRGIAGISTDISEQLAAKEKLKNSERLATIGKMITGLAHECRNALQRSQACLAMLKREVKADAKATDYADRLQQAQDDLRHVFEELRGYASPLHLEKTQSNLRVLIEETWKKITSVAHPPDARLRIVESPLDLTCEVDAFRIQQVLRNILENAISAAPAGSTITVSWTSEDGADGALLRTIIRDEGPGFTSEQRASAFEPFFTTKASGTGLGLTICRRIIEYHGGQIHIEGDSDTGGIVVVTLPQTKGEEPWRDHFGLESRKMNATCESSMRS